MATSGPSRMSMPFAPAVLALVAGATLAFSAALHADVKQYKFENKNKDPKWKATDLHIEFDKDVSWEGKGTPVQDPADTFKDAKGNGTKKPSFARGETGTGVPAGGSVVIDFNFTGDVPIINDWKWTYNNTLCVAFGDDGTNPGRIVSLDGHWAMAPAAGDGLIECHIPGQPAACFSTSPGDDGSTTAQKFAAFIESLPFGLVTAQNGPSASFTSLSYSDALDNISVQVLQQDSGQPVQIERFTNYGTGFEDQPIAGSPGGSPVNQQDGWYTPADPLSVDAMVYSYQGNSIGISELPAGHDQFLATSHGDSPARAQHDVNLSNAEVLTFSYDVNCLYTGAPGDLADFMSSFSLQPSASTRHFIQLNTWQDKVSGTTWNATYAVAPEAPGSPVKSGLADLKLAGPEWQNLAANNWYRLTTTVDFSRNQIIRVTITDLATRKTAHYSPPDWYLDGGSAPSKPLATAVRFFTGNTAGNNAAWDNYSAQAGLGSAPPACYADIDGSGSLDVDDFIAFQTLFGLGACEADCDGSGGLDIDDFICLQTEYAGGCE